MALGVGFEPTRARCLIKGDGAIGRAAAEYIRPRADVLSVKPLVRQVEAIYERGVLRPLEELDLEEGEVVELIVIRRSRALRYAGILKDVPEEEVEEALREVEEGAHIR